MADDNAAVRRSLCLVLQSDRCFRVVGQAENGQDAVAMERNLRPDVVLMDIAMPVLNGIQATRQILTANPEAKVIILSAHGDDEYVEYAAKIGAVGFLKKQSAAEILTKVIHKVLKCRRFFSPAMAKITLRSSSL
ncbi:MAG: response regulator transcription factor [Opitutaceae bacterium]|nr:response regulator transcription factor [Opitutaceae bacterium]